MPGMRRQFGASASPTPDLADTGFNQMAFYPVSCYSRQVQVQPAVTLPPAGSSSVHADDLLGRQRLCRGSDF